LGAPIDLRNPLRMPVVVAQEVVGQQAKQHVGDEVRAGSIRVWETFRNVFPRISFSSRAEEDLADIGRDDERKVVRDGV